MGWSTCKEAGCSGCDNPVYLDPDGWHVRAPSGVTWDPLANPGDLLDVIGAIKDRGWALRFEFAPFSWISAEVVGSPVEVCHVKGGDWRSALAKAVCRAALEAVR
jgi:hypothetical protein